MPKVIHQIRAKMELQVPRRRTPGSHSNQGPSPRTPQKSDKLWPPCLNPGRKAQFLEKQKAGTDPSLQNFCRRPPPWPQNSVSVIMPQIPAALLFSLLCSPHHIIPHLLIDLEGGALPLRTEVSGCTQYSVGTPGGRQSRPKAAGFKVGDTWIHLPRPSRAQTKAAEKPLDKGTGEDKAVWPHYWPPSPTHYPFPALIPFLQKGLANGGVRGLPFPLPGHTHSPFFLKNPRSTGRRRPRNTTMTAGATRTVPYSDLSGAPGTAFTVTQHRVVRVARPAAELAPGRGGGGAALQVLLPPAPLIPPTHRPRPSSGAQWQEPGQILTGKLRPGVCRCSGPVESMTTRDEDTQSQEQPINPSPSPLLNSQEPELWQGSQLPDGGWKSH